MTPPTSSGQRGDFKNSPFNAAYAATSVSTGTGQRNWYEIGGTALEAALAAALIAAAIVLFADDMTGIGVADDPVALAFLTKAFEILSRLAPSSVAPAFATAVKCP